MEVKDVLKAVGLPENIENVEGIVKAVGEKYVVRDQAENDSDIRGRIMKHFAVEHDRIFTKEFGIDKADAEGKTTKELIKMGAAKVNERILELEQSAGKGSDEKVKGLTEKLEKTTLQFTQLKEANEKLLSEKAELQTGFESQLKNIKLDTAFDSAFTKITFPEGTHDFTKKGFKDAVRSKFKLDIDDSGSLNVTDKEGKQIMSKAQAGVFLNLEQVLDKELDEAGLKVKNNVGKSQVNFQQQNNSQNNSGQNNPANKTRTINPKAQQFAQENAGQ